MLSIRKPSLIREMSFISAHDDALAWPDEQDVDGTAAFKHKLEVARDTGDYVPVLIDGKTPLVFTLRPIPAQTLRRLGDAIESGAIGVREWTGLGLRLALISVVGADVQISRAVDEKWGELAAANVLDMFPRDVVTEVGLFAVQRQHTDPKR